MLKYVTADEAVREIKSNDNVFIHSAAATPEVLVKVLVNYKMLISTISIRKAIAVMPKMSIKKVLRFTLFLTAAISGMSKIIT
jgi:DeoR/GlpR family transcriptional regulator of sugar metabolism